MKIKRSIMSTRSCVAIFLALVAVAFSATINFSEIGGIKDDDSLAVVWKNGKLLNSTLANMGNGDTFLFPEGTFYLMGGIVATVSI